MFSLEKLLEYVDKKPLAFIRLKGSESLKILKAERERFTFTQSMPNLNKLKANTLCIVELLYKDADAEIYDSFSGCGEIVPSYQAGCYLGIIKRIEASSTLDKTVTVDDLTPINFESLKDIEDQLKYRFKKSFRIQLARSQRLTVGTPKLNQNIIEMLNKSHNDVLDLLYNKIMSRVNPTPRDWAKKDATNTALSIFGLTLDKAKRQISKARIYEDNYIRTDAANLPGHASKAPDYFGRTVYVKKDERMTIYYTNMMPLETMLGVDLIYVNHSRGNVVMLQYKMLEFEESSGDNIKRIDKQLNDEIERMKIPILSNRKNPGNADTSDYRLDDSPFYFKFATRTHNKSPKAFIISLEHLELYLGTQQAKGNRGGIRISYNALDGCFLRKDGFIELVKSGYIGTYKSETDALADIIDYIAKTGDQDVVLAWQERIDQDEKEEHQKSILEKIVKSRNSTN